HDPRDASHGVRLGRRRRAERTPRARRHRRLAHCDLVHAFRRALRIRDLPQETAREAPSRPQDRRRLRQRCSSRGGIVLKSLPVVLLVVILVGVLAARFHGWSSTHKERRERADRLAAGPRVSVIQVAPTGGERVTVLPGDVRGYKQVALYPKISGYLTE